MIDEPENTGNEQEIERDEKGRYVEGVSGNPAGRPPGSISIKDRIRQYLRDNPNEFENLCQFYIKDRKMRDLLWKMLEGLPKQSTEITGEAGLPLKIVIEQINGGTTNGKEDQAV